MIRPARLVSKYQLSNWSIASWTLKVRPLKMESGCIVTQTSLAHASGWPRWNEALNLLCIQRAAKGKTDSPCKELGVVGKRSSET